MDNIIIFRYKDRVIICDGGQRLIRYDKELIEMTDIELKTWYMKGVGRNEK